MNSSRLLGAITSDAGGDVEANGDGDVEANGDGDVEVNDDGDGEANGDGDDDADGDGDGESNGDGGDCDEEIGGKFLIMSIIVITLMLMVTMMMMPMTLKCLCQLPYNMTETWEWSPIVFLPDCQCAKDIIIITIVKVIILKSAQAIPILKAHTKITYLQSGPSF